MPLVSIGLPTRNRAHLLDRALRTLTKQSYRNVEIIVADNASSDSTEAVGREWAQRDARVHYHRHPENIGSVANFHYVLQKAKGVYFHWRADDDSSTLDFIEETTRFLESNPDVVSCFSDYDFVDDRGNRTGSWSLSHLRPDRDWMMAQKEFFRYPGVSRSVMMIYAVHRRQALQRAMGPLPGQNIRPSLGSEFPILARLAVAGRLVALPRHLYQKENTIGADSEAAVAVRGMRRVDFAVSFLRIQARLASVALRREIPGHVRRRLLRAWAGSFMGRAFGRRGDAGMGTRQLKAEGS